MLLYNDNSFRYMIIAIADILAPECAVPLQTPIANLKAIVEAAREGSPSKMTE